jgi:hypothetical protein
VTTGEYPLLYVFCFFAPAAPLEWDIRLSGIFASRGSCLAWSGDIQGFRVMDGGWSGEGAEREYGLGIQM